MLNLQEIQALLPEQPLRQPELPFPLVASGKVREIYDLEEMLGPYLLIVASDRLSAFDVILPGGVPGKGILLTQLSLWWFSQTDGIMPNHLIENHDAALRELLAKHIDASLVEPYAVRSMLVKKLTPLKLEAVVRGYLAGSGWKEYKQTGMLWDHPLPTGLQESSALPSPLFTPTTKADAGHDEPVSEAGARDIIGPERFDAVKSATLKLYAMGSQKADEAGLILADTKFEFGTDANGTLYLIDEVLTPDSSRYWPREGYTPGKTQPAFDKQYVRDYLETLDWDKTYPGPELPEEVILNTRQKYFEALEHLMG